MDVIFHAVSLSRTGIKLCSKMHIRSKEYLVLVNAFEELF